MPTPTIALVSADYPRLAPLTSGDVRVSGFDLQLIRGPRPEMLRRALGDPGIAGGESSLGIHLRRIAAGDRSFVALPAFVQRSFMARYAYVRSADAGSPLAGRDNLRIGMYAFAATGAIWFRHLLRHLGARLDSAQWRVGPIDAGDAFVADAPLPANAAAAPEGRGLAAMLVDGEIDILLSPWRPQRFDPAGGPIARLFSDARAVDRDYARATSIFPPQHLIVLRRAVWESAPGVARAVQAAFEQAEARFLANLKANPFATPWQEADIEETFALLGEDFHAQGIEPNRAALDVFAEEAHRSGIVSRRIAVDDLFAEFLAS